MALLLSLARHVPAAHLRASRRGTGSRSASREGVELAGKTLGSWLGIGNMARRRAGGRVQDAGHRVRPVHVGREPAKLVRVCRLERPWRVGLPHDPPSPKTSERRGEDHALLKSKQGLTCDQRRLRGGIVDERARRGALRRAPGRRGARRLRHGAARRITRSSPSTRSSSRRTSGRPRRRPSTPWGGYRGQFLVALVRSSTFAVNLAVTEAHDSLRPFLPLAEAPRRLFGSLVGAGLGGAQESQLPSTIGGGRGRDRHPRHPDHRVVRAQGPVLPGVDDPVTYVNAPQPGQGQWPRAARGLLDDFGGLRQPRVGERRGVIPSPARCTGARRATDRRGSTATRSTCPLWITW